MASYFVSDIHLKSNDEPNYQLLMRLLQAIVDRKDTENVFFLGDIFDVWFGAHDYFKKKYSSLVSIVQQMVSQGIVVHYFEGNHDFHLKTYWESELGVRVHRDTLDLSLQGLKMSLEHGDLMNPLDRSYLLLRAFWRNPAMKFLILNAPGELVSFVGEKLSQASRRRSGRRRIFNSESIRSMMHDYARKKLSDGPYDCLVTGHTHILDDCYIEAQGRRGRFINLGSWFEDPHLLIVNSEGQTLKSVLKFLDENNQVVSQGK